MRNIRTVFFINLYSGLTRLYKVESIMGNNYVTLAVCNMFNGSDHIYSCNLGLSSPCHLGFLVLNMHVKLKHSIRLRQLVTLAVASKHH